MQKWIELSMLKRCIALVFGSLVMSQLPAQSVTIESDVFNTLKTQQYWGLVQPGISCVEQYTFKANGEVDIKSHLERITGNYTQLVPTQNIELSAVVIRFETDNQQPDCMGNSTNQAGTSTTNFLKKDSDQKIYFCLDAFGKNCPVYLRPEH